MAGYRVKRDDDGLLRPDWIYATPPLAIAERGKKVASAAGQNLYVASNSLMMVNDRYYIDFEGDDCIDGTLDCLGDGYLLAKIETDKKTFSRVMTALMAYRIPTPEGNCLTQHVVLPFRLLITIIGKEVVGSPPATSGRNVRELMGTDAIDALRVFLRTFPGSRHHNRMYCVFHSHMKTLDCFVSVMTYQSALRELGFRVNREGFVEVSETSGPLMSLMRRTETRTVAKKEKSAEGDAEGDAEGTTEGSIEGATENIESSQEKQKTERSVRFSDQVKQRRFVKDRVGDTNC